MDREEVGDRMQRLGLAPPRTENEPVTAAAPARVVLFEFETPLLHLCPFLAYRGSAEVSTPLQPPIQTTQRHPRRGALASCLT